MLNMLTNFNLLSSRLIQLFFVKLFHTFLHEKGFIFSYRETLNVIAPKAQLRLT